jgi:glycosyltransferase involved in cell wall biosynthesis
VPVVASPVGINRKLVEDSGSGFLAEHPEDWEGAIRMLALDRLLRAKLGSRGRAFVERYADLDGQADTLAALLRGAA